MSKKIEVLAREVRLTGVNDQDYVCLTDIARYKDAERTDYLIFNWLRNRNTIEFLGVWEKINNPSFNPIEFDGIKSLATDFSGRGPRLGCFRSLASKHARRWFSPNGATYGSPGQRPGCKRADNSSPEGAE